MATAIIGSVGLSTLQAHEGLRLKAYRDTGGIPTICYGHTGPDVRMGMTQTVEQCNVLLISDIKEHRKGVEGCVKAPLTRNQRDAVVVFTFNVGVGSFCKSTMAKKLNRLDYVGASDEFPKWKYGKLNGKPTVLPGLVKRRKDERALFLTQGARLAPAASLSTMRTILVGEPNT